MPPSTLAPTDSAAQADSRAGKYLTFQLDREEFGIGVLKVREIMGIQEITAVPQTPAHIKGVLNLRGKVVPVIDLRLKFGMPAAEYTPRTCIIVTQVRGEGGPVLMGAVVDGVSDLPEVVEDGVAGGAAAAFAVPAALAELGFDGAPPEAAFGGGAMAEITELGSW